MRTIIFTIFLLILHCTLTNGNARKDVEIASSALQKANTALEKVNSFIAKANPTKIFSQISKTLVFLGPAMMAVSAILSIVAIFLPQEDSPELKALNAGFDKVNRRLDVITSEIADLKNIVELSAAKSTYVQCLTIIKSNYEALQEANQDNTKGSYDFFVKQYETTYNLAANNLYDALIGKLGPFGFNLINLYKDHVKCNPLLVSKFCTIGMQMLTKGLSVEGGYFGALNLTQKAESKRVEWEGKMKLLGDACEAVIQNCESNWQATSAQQFRETYNKELTDDNQEFANKIAEALNNVAPQRAWLVVSYKDAAGFGEHGFTTFYTPDKIWDQNNHDVTVISGALQETMTGAQYTDMEAKINRHKTNFNNCNQMDWSQQDSGRYGGNDLRSVLNVIRQVFMGGTAYAVRLDKSPGHAVTGNTLFATDFRWSCNSQSYRLLLFV